MNSYVIPKFPCSLLLKLSSGQGHGTNTKFSSLWSSCAANTFFCRQNYAKEIRRLCDCDWFVSINTILLPRTKSCLSNSIILFVHPGMCRLLLQFITKHAIPLYLMQMNEMRFQLFTLELTKQLTSTDKK